MKTSFLSFFIMILAVFIMPKIGNSQIVYYSFSETTGNTFNSIASTGTSVTLGDDADIEKPIGFSFLYNSVNYTVLNISSNGWLRLGSQTATNGTGNIGSYSEAIAPFYDDLNPSSAGNIYYEMQGVAPNRTFVVEYNGVQRYGSANAGVLLTAQAVLYEGSNNIEFRYGSSVGVFLSGSIGLSEDPNGAGHLLSVTPGTPSTTSTATVNYSITAVPVDGVNYLFAYNAPTCPAPGNLSITNIKSDSAQLNWVSGGSSNYNVEYGPTGFTQGTGTMLNIVTDTFVVLSNLTPGTVYDWYVQDSCGVGDASVWISSNFKTDYIAITTFPWNEGFESNNTDQIAVNGWYHQSKSGSYSWTANSSLTSYNRSPRTGAFNAYLKYGNTDWMYVKVSLTSGTNYRLSFWARQDVTSGCTIMASYGINGIDTAMTDTIIAPSAVINGDYANYNNVFSPTTSGIYYIGIKAALTYSPYYVSIDDVSIIEVPLNDVQVSQIVSSYDAYSMTPTDTIIVEVSNNGLNNQTNIPIKYMLDNGTVISDTIPSLNALTTDTFTFASTFDATVGGSHVLTAYTDLSNDEDNSNDTAKLTFITKAQNDLGVITLIAPVSSICGSATSNVKVVVKNYGILTQNNAPISVVITDASGTPVTLTGTTASIASLAIDTVDMGSANTVASGMYNVMAYSSLSTDTIFNDNDTLNTTFEIASVFTASHVEDFEDGGINWTRTGMSISAYGHGKSGKGMYKNFYSSAMHGSAILSHKITSITANSSFVFDYQIKNWSGGTPTALAGDKFYFMLSTDCGTTFDTIATIDSTNHTATLDWTHKMIDISSYVGQDVVIKFSGVRAAGDYYFNMDNVGIANPPAAINLGIDTTICLNSGFALDANSGSGSYYMWTANNDTLTFTGAILNVDTAATYAVKVIAPAGTVYDTIVITTHAVTMVSFTSLDTAYCSTADPVTLVATPTGGAFTGNGVTADSFDPHTSGLGEQVITYAFTDANTCVYTTSDTTFINEGPMLSLTADVDICLGDSVTLFAAPIVAAPGVFFSMYIEGSGNNKALEVYNGTSATINLDEYSIMTNYNGHAWSGQYNFPAGATLDAGDVFVIANDGSDEVVLAVADDSLVYNAGGYVVGFNGDDVRALYHKTTATDSSMIDIIGLYDLTDPGSGWGVAGVDDATKDHSLIRKSSIVGGSTDWNAIAGTDVASSQYEVLPKNTFTGIGSHTVTPPAANMDTYLWSTGESTISIVVKPTATTTYTVTVANTLCSDEGAVIVTVNAYPVVDLGPDQNVKFINGSVNLDAGNVGATYLWSTGETSQIVTFNNSNLVIGDTTVSVAVDNNGCVASDTITLTVIDDTSIDDMLNNVNVSIYPNPNNGRFNMTIEGMTGEFNMQIVSINGKVVYNESMNSASAQNISIDVSELASGVYYIKLMNNNGVKTEKLIIK